MGGELPESRQESADLESRLDRADRLDMAARGIAVPDDDVPDDANSDDGDSFDGDSGDANSGVGDIGDGHPDELRGVSAPTAFRRQADPTPAAPIEPPEVAQPNPELARFGREPTALRPVPPVAPAVSVDVHGALAPMVRPTWTDPTAARAARFVGGAWGRRAIMPPGSFWNPARVVLLLMTFTLLLGFGEKFPCANGQWTGHKQYTHACYSDVVPLWGAEGLSSGAVPYRDHAVEYPVLTGGFLWVTQAGVRLWQSLATAGVLPVMTDISIFSLLSCLGLALCGLIAARATAGAAGRRPYDAVIFALSPLVVFHAFSNWDLLAVMFTSLALWAWSRDQPVIAGVMIGLGTAAKLYPALMLIPLAVLAIRTLMFRPVIWAAGAALATWLAINLPMAYAYHRGWEEFFTFNQDRPSEASTIWYIAHYLRVVGLDVGIPPGTQPNLAVAIAVVLAVSAVVFIGLFAPTRPRVGQLAFLVVAAFLLTTKVWSPQYSIWLVPLLALARPRWRLSLLWQSSEVVVWILTLLWLISFDEPVHGVNYPVLMAALFVRDGLILLICGLIVREMWKPELDVVRASGLDDPAGGPYDGAPDLFSLADVFAPNPTPAEPEPEFVS
jgi:uncharacterized membrane protein